MKFYTLDGQFIKESNMLPHNFTGIVTWGNGDKEWFVNGKLHRLDGPAVEFADGTKVWYIDGKPGTEKQCNLLHSIMKLKGLV